ncbi:unnamed protein product [Enterobius vermicularis]|uniref:LRAT domain-containing protein n=1 Tax=Enterobius vermicularis TaxID=51028 RepID=A0A0N4V1T4_ENTVE|nr:unnamed protein product [Enterobius vermicularis]
MGNSDSSDEILETDWLQWQELEPCLEIGDLIEFHRGIYNVRTILVVEVEAIPFVSRALCVARKDGTVYVAQLSPGENECGGESSSSSGSSVMIANADKAKVRIDRLSAVSEGNYCRKNNSLDCEYTLFSQSVIVDRAQNRVLECCRWYWRLQFVFNNCDQFVRYCRYGKAESDQAEAAEAVVDTAVIGLIGADQLADGIVEEVQDNQTEPKASYIS